MLNIIIEPMQGTITTALTIAGSDPSGGAGIQADLKTFSSLRVYGMTVIAALTAQNTSGVSDVAEVAPDFVAKQLDAVLSDIVPDATKTGMLLTAEVIEIVAAKVLQYQLRNLILDPVIASSSGTALLRSNALDALRRLLLPLSLLITPNLDEARILTSRKIETTEDMEEAALQIHGMGASFILIKGGHLKGGLATDVLFDGNQFIHLDARRIETRDTHGTGCVLSAAIAAYVAKGHPVPEAVRLGKEFVTNAIRNSLRLGRGTGPCDPLSIRS
jgi:hydroxymethylpyrimidine/phosphomethylpyrimidine kinase